MELFLAMKLPWLDELNSRTTRTSAQHFTSVSVLKQWPRPGLVLTKCRAEYLFRIWFRGELLTTLQIIEVLLEAINCLLLIWLLWDCGISLKISGIFQAKCSKGRRCYIVIWARTCSTIASIPWGGANEEEFFLPSGEFFSRSSSLEVKSSFALEGD